jgi:hypothetical protein
MLDPVKIAAVLDAAADHLDAVEQAKLSSIRAERQSIVDALAAKYAETHGEELPEKIRQKLAASDTDVINLLHTMVEKNAGRPEALGGPSDRDDEKQSLSVKEAADAAWDRFGNWLTS